ncbi:MAG TPA: EAL domain-containing protein [bacterium]|jgi:EAL domain-containing protein (putative c-di-GMP-specific phosphodiesterase class I)|nr:EAL domain-containing protein [bacterium]
MQNHSTLDSPKASYPIHPFHILEQSSVASFFEPLFSLSKMGVVGLDTLNRAVHPDNQSLIEPKDIFRGMGSQEPGLKLALDRLFRQKGLEGFSPFQLQSPNLLLLLDIEPSVLKGNTVGSGHLLSQVQKLGLSPQQIAVGISLTAEMDLKFVGKFMEIQHGFGFLLALRDASARPEDLDAILRFNPDMVQVKDSLVRGLAGKTENKRAFQRISKLAHALGILVIAGGLENEEDALVALELGADLLQGKYFFLNPKAQTVLTLGRKARMQFLADRYRRNMTRKAKGDRELMNRCKWIAGSIFERLETPPETGLEGQFTSIFRQYPALECLYLLDGEGLQVSEAVCSEVHVPERKKILFQLSPKGADHSLREYYYALTGGQESHVTGPYLSMNSGNLCITASKITADPFHGATILCADLNLSKV